MGDFFLSLEIVFSEAGDFKRCIDAISVLVGEAQFIVDSAGISLKATDPSQISMVSFSLAKSALKAFNADCESKIGLDLNYLSKIMARAKQKDELSLKLDSDSNSLLISLKGASKRNFSIPLIDVSQANLSLPRIDFDSEIILKAGSMQDSLKDAALLSSHITLSVKDESFIVLADSSKGSFRNELSKGDSSLISVNSKADSFAMFPLDYLSNLFKAASSDDTAAIFLKKDAPVRVDYAIGEAKIVYFLAPRIESE